ncbi:MAG TPA: hypothetical protein VJQ82_16050 [Terriglobales bacterium]|nr:hypothetical protein [Terriglobales bacterium]
MNDKTGNRRAEVKGQASAPDLLELLEILMRVDLLAIVDTRPEEEILGYDENGIPA